MSVWLWQAAVAFGMSVLLSVYWLLWGEHATGRSGSVADAPAPDGDQGPPAPGSPQSAGGDVARLDRPVFAGLRFPEPDVALMQRVLDGLRALPTGLERDR